MSALNNVGYSTQKNVVIKSWSLSACCLAFPRPSPRHPESRNAQHPKNHSVSISRSSTHHPDASPAPSRRLAVLQHHRRDVRVRRRFHPGGERVPGDRPRGGSVALKVKAIASARACRARSSRRSCGAGPRRVRLDGRVRGDQHHAHGAGQGRMPRDARGRSVRSPEASQKRSAAKASSRAPASKPVAAFRRCPPAPASRDDAKTAARARCGAGAREPDADDAKRAAGERGELHRVPAHGRAFPGDARQVRAHVATT